jgi:DNA-binding NtrC family response regulator
VQPDDVATELHETPLQNEGDGAFSLSVVDGPDKGLSLVIDGSQEMEVIVGQSPVCRLKVSDVTVSRRHAALEVSGARLRIRDLGSRNGTFINGVLVAEAFAVGGERIRLGATTLLVSRVADTPASAHAESSFGPLLAQSRAMRRLFPLLERLAASTLPVLVEGETGTGKEVLARALHERSPRARGPFVVFDCSAVAANVIESELFGHERGAFTGAVGSRMGLFEQAKGGTLFLDELGDLPLDLQGKLLRAIERSEVRRVGGNQWIQVDVRIVAATRRDIDSYVQDGRFRDDLFHRLAVGRVELPPLRKRIEDIALLARHFAAAVDPEAVIPEHVLAEWRSQAWPGNVRELRNAVLRHVALGELDTEEEEPVAMPPTQAGESEIDAVLRLRLPYSKARARVLRTFEQRYLEEMLAFAGGSVQKAAQASGVALRYFQVLRARNKR